MYKLLEVHVLKELNILFEQEKNCLTFEQPPTLMQCLWTAADVYLILQRVKEGSDYYYSIIIIIT